MAKKTAKRKATKPQTADETQIVDVEHTTERLEVKEETKHLKLKLTTRELLAIAAYRDLSANHEGERRARLWDEVNNLITYPENFDLTSEVTESPYLRDWSPAKFNPEYDPRPDIPDIGGVPIAPWQKHYLKEAFAIVGYLVGLEIIPIMPPREYPETDMSQEVIQAAMIISGAFYRLMCEEPVLELAE